MRDRVALVADDLTGALDSAAPFAGAAPASRVSVVWLPDKVPGPVARLGISTESRSLAPVAACDRVRAALNSLPQADIRFKKIDSLARGNTCHEIAACLDVDLFGIIVVVDGRIHTAEGIVELAGPLSDLGVRFETRARGATMPVRKGVILCDAETDADLRRIVAEADHMAAPLLFCGSGGLAAALAPPFRAVKKAPIPDLAIFGSQTAVSRGHLARFSEHRSVEAAIRSTPETWREAVDWNAPRLAIGFDMPPRAPHLADRAVRTALADLHRQRTRPEAVLVVGGDTLRRVLDVSSGSSVDVYGAWAPGIAVSRVKDGSWAGTWLYSMSGSFDDAGLIDAISHGDPCSAHH